MRFVDFLIHLLQTQGETLQRLAAFFGEEELLGLLEAAGDDSGSPSIEFSVQSQWFEDASAHAKGAEPKTVEIKARKPIYAESPYTELESTVHEINLPAILEFHLWAYPFYRFLIEGSFDLNSKIRSSPDSAIDSLVEEALHQANLWIKNLPMSPDQSKQAERIALVPWLRFRSAVLKKAGKRPITSVD